MPKYSVLMSAAGHDRVDMLKIDIEGAEHRVVESDARNQESVLSSCAIEIDQPVSAWTFWKTVRRISWPATPSSPSIIANLYFRPR